MLVLALVLLIGAVGAAIVGLSLETAARGRVQSVADLTALAATHGTDDAGEVARRNGGRLLDVERDDDVTTVVVELRGRRAVAAAQR